MVKQLLLKLIKTTSKKTEPEEVVVQEATETEEEKYNRSLKKTRTGFSARFERVLG